MRIGLQYTSERDEPMKQQLSESVVRKLDEGAEFAMLAFFYSDIRRAKDFRDMGVSRKDCESFYSPETIKYLFDVMKEGETQPDHQGREVLQHLQDGAEDQPEGRDLRGSAGQDPNMMENQYREENRKKLRDHLRKDSYLWPPDLFDQENEKTSRGPRPRTLGGPGRPRRHGVERLRSDRRRLVRPR
jgi:hypothetical protein